MKYYKQYKEMNAEPFEITKEDARRTLAKWWEEAIIAGAFDGGKEFRLYTPTAEVWASENGTVPEYGVAAE